MNDRSRAQLSIGPHGLLPLIGEVRRIQSGRAQTPRICERTVGQSLHPLKLGPTPPSETQSDQPSVPARVTPASVPAVHQLTVAGRCAGAGTRVTR